ncbi:MAG: tellurium resistance protein TerC [Pirellulaceae bacterium]|nr:hypothetical protein [Planctomycetales bacterium]
MLEVFTVSNLITLVMLTLLQIVLGFDNLLYISIESKRVPAEKQPFVRRTGIGLAIALRILLLFIVSHAIERFQSTILALHVAKVVDMDLNGHSLIVLAGGVFIIYTAIKEIYHMVSGHSLEHNESTAQRSVAMSITWIVLMNLVFSFDSILGALALTKVFAVMATAIIISGILMMVLSDRVSEFLKKNRMYEILGLFILLIVGIMLVSEGGHLGHLALFGHEIEAMKKPTFYFVLGVLVLVDIAQSRYQKKLLASQQSQLLANQSIN